MSRIREHLISLKINLNVLSAVSLSVPSSDVAKQVSVMFDGKLF